MAYRYKDPFASPKSLAQLKFNKQEKGRHEKSVGKRSFSRFKKIVGAGVATGGVVGGLEGHRLGSGLRFPHRNVHTLRSGSLKRAYAYARVGGKSRGQALGAAARRLSKGVTPKSLRYGLAGAAIGATVGGTVATWPGIAAAAVSNKAEKDYPQKHASRLQRFRKKHGLKEAAKTAFNPKRYPVPLTHKAFDRREKRHRELSVVGRRAAFVGGIGAAGVAVGAGIGAAHAARGFTRHLRKELKPHLPGISHTLQKAYWRVRNAGGTKRGAVKGAYRAARGLGLGELPKAYASRMAVGAWYPARIGGLAGVIGGSLAAERMTKPSKHYAKDLAKRKAEFKLARRLAKKEGVPTESVVDAANSFLDEVKYLPGSQGPVIDMTQNRSGTFTKRYLGSGRMKRHLRRGGLGAALLGGTALALHQRKKNRVQEGWKGSKPIRAVRRTYHVLAGTVGHKAEAGAARAARRAKADRAAARVADRLGDAFRKKFQKLGIPASAVQDGKKLHAKAARGFKRAKNLGTLAGLHHEHTYQMRKKALGVGAAGVGVATGGGYAGYHKLKSRKVARKGKKVNESRGSVVRKARKFLHTLKGTQAKAASRQAAKFQHRADVATSVLRERPSKFDRKVAGIMKAHGKSDFHNRVRVDFHGRWATKAAKLSKKAANLRSTAGKHQAATRVARTKVGAAAGVGAVGAGATGVAVHKRKQEAYDAATNFLQEVAMIKQSLRAVKSVGSALTGSKVRQAQKLASKSHGKAQRLNRIAAKAKMQGRTAVHKDLTKSATHHYTRGAGLDRSAVKLAKYSKKVHKIAAGGASAAAATGAVARYQKQESLEEGAVRDFGTRLRHPRMATKHKNEFDRIHGKSRYGVLPHPGGVFVSVASREWRGKKGKRPGARLVTASGRAYERKRKAYATDRIRGKGLKAALRKHHYNLG